jgi:methionyl-tRNA formyltransferase
MRLIIFTNRDLASNLFLNHIMPHVAPYVVHIFVSDKVGKATTSATPKALKDLKFFEQILPNDFIFPPFDALNRKYTDGTSRENREGGNLMTFNEISRHYNVPIASLNDVRSVDSLDKIAALQPDLALSVRFGRIFGSDFLKIPKRGVINLHSGRLPQYRGVLPAFRALMNDDEVIYPTLHYIEDGTIDTGGIIGFAELKTEQDKSLLWHILHLYIASVDLVVNAIHQIAAGKKPLAHEQEDTNAAYFTFPTAEEFAQFSEKTKRQLIDVEEYTTFLNKYKSPPQ